MPDFDGALPGLADIITEAFGFASDAFSWVSPGLALFAAIMAILAIINVIKFITPGRDVLGERSEEEVDPMEVGRPFGRNRRYERFMRDLHRQQRLAEWEPENFDPFLPDDYGKRW